jgi:hypothetical protein
MTKGKVVSGVVFVIVLVGSLLLHSDRSQT